MQNNGPNDNDKEKKQADYMRHLLYGVSMGICFGTSIGMLLGNLILGMVPGMGLGMAMGIATYRQKKQK